MFNMGKTEAFTPTWDIRQGDPISPYVFILRIEFLGSLIQEKVTNNEWHPIQIARSSPSFFPSLPCI